jgi:glycerophosphoryl diester phosphodiesterase
MQLSPLAPIDAWFARANPRADWLRGAVYAHRGLHGAGAVENSPTAFARAIAAGLGIECDVQLSADGAAMVFHDYTLDRLTGASGKLALRTAAELAQIALGNSDAIPRLEDLLAQVGSKVPLLIEIKAQPRGRRAALCRAVHHALDGYTGPHAVMSFDPRIVRWFARHAPHTVRGLVVTEEHHRGMLGALRRHGALWLARAQFLAYDVCDLPSRFAASQRARGLPLLTWTVCSPALRRRAADHADAPIAEGEGVALS